MSDTTALMPCQPTEMSPEGLDPLQGIQRAHVELYIGQIGDSGLMDSSAVTTMHAVRG